MNLAILCGRLAHTPELKATPTGAKVVTASLATNHVYYNDKKEKIESTEWHNLVAWNKTAETMAQYLKGGDQIMVHGRIVTRSWEDKDGVKKYRTEIIIEKFEFGSKNMSRDDRGQTSAPKKTSTRSQQDEVWDSMGTDKTPRKKVEQYNDSIDYPDEDINAEDIPF